VNNVALAFRETYEGSELS